VIVDQRDHQVAVLRNVGVLCDDDVAIQNAVLDEAVTLHLECKVVAPFVWDQERRNLDGVVAFDRLDGPAGGDGAGQLDCSHVGAAVLADLNGSWPIVVLPEKALLLEGLNVEVGGRDRGKPQVLFDFFQGGGIVVLLDEDLEEIEDLLLSLGEHGASFDLLSIIVPLEGRVNKKMRRGDWRAGGGGGGAG